MSERRRRKPKSSREELDLEEDFDREPKGREKNFVPIALWIILVVTLGLWIWNQYFHGGKGISFNFLERIGKNLGTSKGEGKVERGEEPGSYFLVFLPDAKLDLLVPLSLRYKSTSTSEEERLAELLTEVLSLKHPAVYNPFSGDLKVEELRFKEGFLKVVLNSPKLLSFSYGSETEHLAIQSLILTAKYNGFPVRAIKLTYKLGDKEEVISTSHYGPLDLRLDEEVFVNPIGEGIEKPVLIFYVLRGSDLLIPLTFDSSQDPFTLLFNPPSPYLELRSLVEVYDLQVSKRGDKVVVKLRRKLYKRALFNLLKALKCTFGERLMVIDSNGSEIDLSAITPNLVGINPLEF